MDEVIAKVDADDLQKVKEILLKKAGVDEKTNGYWIQTLGMFDLHKVDDYSNYKNLVKSIDGAPTSSRMLS